MKKWIALLLALLLPVCISLSALAVETDFSAYSDSELDALLSAVQQEAANRHMEKTAKLRAGTYYCSRQIPAGAYILTCKPDGTDGGSVSLTDANDDYILYEYISKNENSVFYIEILEGCILKLSIPAELTITTGILFE